MASIIVRNLDDTLKRRLRIRAAQNGRSMEQEARDILRAALDEDSGPTRNLGTTLHDLIQAVRRGGVGDPPQGTHARSPAVRLTAASCSFSTPTLSQS